MFPDCWDVQTFAGQYSDQLFAKCMFSWLSRNVYSLYILLREYGNPVIDQLILFVLRHWHCPMPMPLFHKLNCRKSFMYYFRFKENDKEELNNFRTLPRQILQLFSCLQIYEGLRFFLRFKFFWISPVTFWRKSRECFVGAGTDL